MKYLIFLVVAFVISTSIYMVFYSHQPTFQNYTEQNANKLVVQEGNDRETQFAFMQEPYLLPIDKNDRCSYLKNKNSLLPELVIEKKVQLSKLIIQSINDGISVNALDYLGLISNIGVINIRELRKISNTDEFSVEYATQEQNLVFKDLLTTDSFDAFLKNFSGNNLDSEAFYTIGNKSQSVFRHIIDRFKLLNKHQAQRLAETGIPYKSIDMLYAMEAGLDFEAINALILDSDVVPDFVNRIDVFHISLASKSIMLSDFAAAKYWHEKGSPFNADPIFYDAVELLFKYGSKFSAEEYNDLVKMVAKEPLLPRSLKKLALSLSKDQRKRLGKPKVLKVSELLSSQDIEEAKSLQSDLFEIAISIVSDPVISEADACYEPTAKYILKQIFSNKIESTKLAKNDNRYEGAKSDFSKDIMQAVKSLKTKEEIENELLTLGPLNGKLAVEQYRRMLLQEELQAFEEATKSQQHLTETQVYKKMESLYQSALDNNWEDAISKGREIFSDENELYEHLMSTALMMDELPIKRIGQFLDKGASFPKSTVSSLVRANKRKELKELFAMGLEIGKQRSQKYTMSAILGGRPDMLRLLIDEGVSVQSSAFEMDSLNYALNRYQLNDNVSDTLVSILISENGVMVGDSHREQMKRMKETRQDEFEHLVDIYPHLQP